MSDPVSTKLSSSRGLATGLPDADAEIPSDKTTNFLQILPNL